MHTVCIEGLYEIIKIFKNFNYPLLEFNRNLFWTYIIVFKSLFTVSHFCRIIL